MAPFSPIHISPVEDILACKPPVDDDVKKVSKLADLVVCGSSIVEKIKEGSQKGLTNQNLAQFVGEYVKTLSQGVKN